MRDLHDLDASKNSEWSGVVKDNTTYHWPPAHWRLSTTSEVQRYHNWQRSRTEMILSTPHQPFHTRCMRLVVFTSTSEKAPSLQNTPWPIFRFSRVWWHCYPSSPCHSRQAFESLHCKIISAWNRSSAIASGSEWLYVACVFRQESTGIEQSCGSLEGQRLPG